MDTDSREPNITVSAQPTIFLLKEGKLSGGLNVLFKKAFCQNTGFPAFLVFPSFPTFS